MDTIRSYIMWPIAALAMSLIISCGGGSGGGGGTSNPVLPGGGASSPTVSVSNTTPAPGETFTVTVGIPSATDLYQADLEMDYNNSVIDIVNPPAGGTPTSIATAVTKGDIFDTYMLDYEVTGIPTNLIITLYNADDTTYTGSNGTLVTFTFVANTGASGQSATINFSNTGTFYTYGSGTTSVPLISSVLIDVQAP